MHSVVMRKKIKIYHTTYMYHWSMDLPHCNDNRCIRFDGRHGKLGGDVRDGGNLGHDIYRSILSRTVSVSFSTVHNYFERHHYYVCDFRGLILRKNIVAISCNIFNGWLANWVLNAIVYNSTYSTYNRIYLRSVNGSTNPRWVVLYGIPCQYHVSLILWQRFVISIHVSLLVVPQVH